MRNAEQCEGRGSYTFVFAFGSLILFLAARFIGEANPDWRLVSWVMAMSAISFTLAVVRLIWGAHVVRRIAFPLCFFLVAVPWPTPIEHSIIQTLTRWIVVFTTELLNVIGVVAVPNGNVMETVGGVVDVDDACSGIRSLQAGLMLALFFGEMRRLTFLRRLSLCGIAVVLACLFNLCRTFVLTYAAAQRGTAELNQWHDPTGVAILIACFVGVWASSVVLGRRQSSIPAAASLSAIVKTPRPPLAKFALIVLSILIGGEVFIHAWYAAAKPEPIVDWKADFPTNNASFLRVELPPRAREILRCNASENGKWQNHDGTRWQMFYLRWLPGRTAIHLARSHTPEICLPSGGRKLHGSFDALVTAHGLNFPFRCYVAGEGLRRLYVFYTLWEDGASEQAVTTRKLDRRSRIDAVLQRRRNPGQRVVQIVLSGARDEAHAIDLVRKELPNLIRR